MSILKGLDDANNDGIVLDGVSSDAYTGREIVFEKLRHNYRKMVIMVHLDEWCEELN